MKSVWESRTLPYIIPLSIGIIFLLVTLNSPTESGNNLSIRLTIVIPEILIWTIASLGAFRFKRYANSIKNYPDGKGLNQIANALLLLVLYIILLTTSGPIVNLLADTQYLDLAVALKNHLPVLTILASALFLMKGSADLNKVIDNNIWTTTRSILLAVSSVIFLMIFSYVFYAADPTSITVNGIPRFALPIQVLLFSYILPHVVVWFIGIKACANLINYASKVQGSIYKSLFKNLYQGIILAFISIFIAQFLIISSLTVEGLNIVLGIIYGILLLCIIGFILILRGAQKLDQVEKPLAG